MNKHAQDILKKIKEDHVEPKPTWKARWKYYAFWLVLCLMMIIGSLFFSLILLDLLGVGRELFRDLGMTHFFRIMLFAAPLIWISLAILALIFGILAFKKTRYGYRYKTLSIVCLAVLIISLLGAVIHFSKMNEKMRERMEKGMPPHMQKFMPPGEKRWLQPDQGVLVGKIVQAGDKLIILNTHDRTKWEVSYTEETKINRKVELKEGEKIMAVGKKTSEDSFDAKAIKPFQKRPGMNRKKLMNPDRPATSPRH